MKNNGFSERKYHMARKRITQIFPWLIPLRTKQRLFCFYLGMRFDGRKYSKTQAGELLPVQVFESVCPMYNNNTGFDMVYQENKVHNLKLAAAAINQMLIRPGETFSLFKSIQHADRNTPYKEGLTVIDGRLTTIAGGGMCQISNLLFWIFLHSPLTIVERHGHRVKDFPEPESDAVHGVDATVFEGWLDLKVKNDTDQTFQISISFDSAHIIGRLYTDQNNAIAYEIVNGDITYYRQNGEVFEHAQVIQNEILKETGTCIAAKKLYINQCKIGYPLPADTPIIGKGAEHE